MPEEKYDPQEQRRWAVEAPPPEVSDAQLVLQENARRFREESARLQAEQSAREQIQRDRQRAHEELARREDDAIRARIFARYLQAEEQAARAKAQAEAEAAAAASLPPPRLSAEAELEIAAGRRTLAKHAQRAQDAAAARDQNKVEEKAEKEATPGFKT